MKLDAVRLRLAIRLLPLLDARHRTMSATLGKTGRKAGGRAARKPGAGAEAALVWAQLYELPLRQHLAQAAVALDFDRELMSAARGELSMSALVELLERPPDEDVEQPSAAPQDPVAAGWAAFGYTHSLRCTLRAMLLFGNPLNALVERARAHRDDKALLDAIRVDPAVVSGRTAAQRIARACLEDDRGFIGSVRRALEGRLGKREAASLARMRMVIGELARAQAARLDDRELLALHARLQRLYPSALRAGNGAQRLRASAARFVGSIPARAASAPAAPSPTRAASRALAASSRAGTRG